MPDTVAPRLRERQAAHNLLLEVELERISTALRSRGIPVAVLKGVPLAHRLYGRLDARRIVDNDLLVHRHHVARAVAVLRGLGYRDRGPRLADQLRTDFQHPLVRATAGGGLVRAEVHWHPFDLGLHPLPEDRVWAHMEEVALPGWNGAALTVPDAPLTVVLLAAHYAQDGFARRQTLHDLARAWDLVGRRGDHRRQVAHLAHAARLGPTLDYALGVAQRLGLLATPVPAPGSRRARILLRVAPRGRRVRVEPSADHPGQAQRLLLTSPLPALRLVRDRAFPPRATLAALRGRSRVRWSALHYALRPLRPLWRYPLARWRAARRRVGGR